MATSINQVKRLKTWIEGFDPLVDGGIPRPSFVLLAGHPGTGKSTFGLQFLLNGLKHDNELGVYASFLETQEVFVRNMSSNYGFDLDTSVKDRKLSFLEYTPLSVDASVDILNEIVKTVVDSRATRLVIDSLNALLGEIPAAEQRRMLEIVINKILKGAECTVIGIIEQSIGKNEIGLGIEEFVADGLILFESYSDGLEVKKRAVIRKMRGSMHSSRYQGIMLRPREGISFFPLAEQ